MKPRSVDDAVLEELMSTINHALEGNDVLTAVNALKETLKTYGGGIKNTAKRTGLNRTAIYKIENPTVETLIRLLQLIDLRLVIKKTVPRQD